MIDPETDRVLGLSGAATLGLWVINHLWRMFGKTRVEGARDRAEVDIIDTLRTENKMLRDQRDQAVSETQQLREQVAQLRNDIAEMERQLGDMRRRLAAIGGEE